MLAGTHAPHAGADGLDDARALVAEHGRARRRRRAVDRVQVGVADAARVQAHERLARVRRLELELGDLEPSARLGQHGRTNLHSVTDRRLGGGGPAACICRSSSSGMWQRIVCSGSTSTSAGSTSSQIAPR